MPPLNMSADAPLNMSADALSAGQYRLRSNIVFYKEDDGTMVDVSKGTIITIKNEDVGVEGSPNSVGMFGNTPDEIRIIIEPQDHQYLVKIGENTVGGRRRKHRKTRKHKKTKKHRKSRRSRRHN